MYKSAIYAYDANFPLYDKNRITKFKNLLMGYLYKFGVVNSKRESKFYVPDFMYSKKYFPKYLEGSGYLMSSDVAFKLYEESFKTKIFHFEDIFLTGFVAPKIQIPLTNYPNMRLNFDKSNFCKFYAVILVHRVNAEEMFEAFNFLTQKENFCEFYDESSLWLKFKAWQSGQFEG